MGVLAGRSGRKPIWEFKTSVATAFEMRAPGNVLPEFIAWLAGRSDRRDRLEFTTYMATAFRLIIGGISTTSHRV